MLANEYQDQARLTAVYPPNFGIEYCIHGLTNEAGEIAGVQKKYIRGDFNLEEHRTRTIKELGDVLWYAANLAYELGVDLEYVMKENLKKLVDRQQRGVLTGDGDNR